ncbi:MAG: hypothetical protein RLZ98_2651 [Pseudomonadota bacterium]|jgi:long-chain acyl-CoA synthetase
MTDNGPAAGRPEAESLPWIANYPDGVNWFEPLEPRPVSAMLERSATRFGTRPCTNFFGKINTFAEIDKLASQAAKGLQDLGVSKGTKVGLFLPNSPTFVVYYYAIMKIGAVVVNYNPLYTVEELAYQVKDSETEIMVTLDLSILFTKVDALLAQGSLKRAIVASFPALLPTTKSILFRLFKAKELASPAKSSEITKIVLERDLLANTGNYAPVPIDPVNDTAVLQYTGGTTGTPKGAELTHANVTINVQQIAAWAPELVPGEERMMGVLPFFHVFAMTCVMNFSVAQGAEIVIMPRFVLVDALKLITKSRPTCMPGVPTLFNAINNYDNLRAYDLSSLKFCLSGGAPLPFEVKQQFEKLAGCKLVEGYGLSETSPVLTANPISGIVKESSSIGQPLPGTIISLRDLEDPTKEVPQGERGELCAKGPQVMKGYWKRPDATRDVFVDGFLRTGDVAIMDKQGFFEIVDRIKDLIICSGYNVYPRRIEDALYEHPAVEEVTVIGIKDAYRGEAPKAFIKLRSGMKATKEDLLRHLEPKLSRIEIPAEFEFRDALPKTMIGKLSKKELVAEEKAKAEAAAKAT